MALSATALTETSAFTAAVYPPQAATDVEADDVGAGEQALANRTLFLNDTKFDKAGGTVTGATIFSNTVALNGATTTTAKVILSGNGAGIRRRWGDVSDTDATIDTTKDVYLCSAASAGRSLTLSVSTGTIPQDGEEVSVLCVGAVGGSYAVFYEGSASPMISALGGSSTDAMATFIYRASTARWYLLSATGGTVETNALA
jgi:hypothetical protein